MMNKQSYSDKSCLGFNSKLISVKLSNKCFIHIRAKAISGQKKSSRREEGGASAKNFGFLLLTLSVRARNAVLVVDED